MLFSAMLDINNNNNTRAVVVKAQNENVPMIMLDGLHDAVISLRILLNEYCALKTWYDATWILRDRRSASCVKHLLQRIKLAHTVLSKRLQLVKEFWHTTT